MKWLARWTSALLTGLFGLGVHGGVLLTVTVQNPEKITIPEIPNLEAVLQDHVKAAGDTWFRWLEINGDRRIEIAVVIEQYPTDTGGGNSTASSFTGKVGKRNVFEQGVAAELRTGLDTNGETLDARIVIDPDYLKTQLWFDPNPSTRTNTIPDNRIDAMSFLSHEMGHILGFLGWYNFSTGALPEDYESTYDRWMQFDGTNYWFTGPVTRTVYGADLPLSRIGNNGYHYGNPVNGTAPGGDPRLIRGLMNGVYFLYGTRYEPSLLDLAILKDLQLSVRSSVVFEERPIVTIHRSPNGSVILRWSANPLRHYDIQLSEGLGLSWISKGTRTLPGLTADWLEFEIDVSLKSQGYFRVVPNF